MARGGVGLTPLAKVELRATTFNSPIFPSMVKPQQTNLGDRGCLSKI